MSGRRTKSERHCRHGRKAAVLPDLARSRTLDRSALDRRIFYRGVNKLLRQTKTELAGGDISHRESVGVRCHALRICSVEERPFGVSGAMVGDIIYVSGPLGGWRHKREIIPRLDFGRKLIGKATSCMDISDGLALDLHRLCRASGVAAEIDSVPLLDGATIEQALHDGRRLRAGFQAAPEKRRVA